MEKPEDPPCTLVPDERSPQGPTGQDVDVLVTLGREACSTGCLSPCSTSVWPDQEGKMKYRYEERKRW